MSGTSEMYHAGSRELQDRFDTRRLADRLVEVTVHERFTPEDRAFIERLDMFFLATVDDEGQPTCSYKGGDPGFVRVVDPVRRRAPRALPGSAIHGARRGAANLSELPALHPPLPTG